MIVVLLLFFAASIKYALTGHAELFSWTAVYNARDFSLKAVVAGSALAVSSYLGFDAITTLTEEAKDQRQVGTAVILACVVQTFIYLGVAYFGTIVAPDWKAIVNPETAAFRIASKVGGAALQAFVSLVIIVSGVSTALAGQASASRLLFGMGRDKVIPARFFAHVHPKFKTPIYSIVFMAVISLVGALTISMTTLAELVAFGGLFGFMCVNLAVIFQYYIKDKSGSLLWHVLCPLVGLVVCGYILWGLAPVARVVGFTWMGVGVAYLVLRSVLSEDFRKLLEKGAFAEPQ
jgi:amino acid transporter